MFESLFRAVNGITSLNYSVLLLLLQELFYFWLLKRFDILAIFRVSFVKLVYARNERKYIRFATNILKF